jgi:AAA domain
MSILSKILERKQEQGAFVAIAGERLAGKSTLAGTLPNRTLLLQAAFFETGSNSAVKLAEQRGSKLDVGTFSSVKELLEVLSSKEVLEYNNIYLDSITAVTEMRHRDPDVTKVLDKNVWDGYRLIGESSTEVLAKLKSLAELHGLNVFITIALEQKKDESGQAELRAVTKGNITLTWLKARCPVVVCPIIEFDDKGTLHRKILTRSKGLYSARIDSLLDHENPAEIPADLTQLLTLIKG